MRRKTWLLHPGRAAEGVSAHPTLAENIVCEQQEGSWHTAGVGLAVSRDAVQNNKSCHSQWLFQTRLHPCQAGPHSQLQDYSTDTQLNSIQERPLSEILLGQGEQRKASKRSAFVEQQVAMSAALSTASEPLTSLAGQRASTTLTPKPRLVSRAGAAKHLAAGGQEALQGHSPSPGTPMPYLQLPPHLWPAAQRALGLPAQYRPWHHCQNHPTMGPVSMAPAPAKHIPHCWAHPNAPRWCYRPQEWLAHWGSHRPVLGTDSAAILHQQRTSRWHSTPWMAEIHVSREEWVEAGWQSNQPSCFTMQREPKPAWDNSAPHGLKSSQQHPTLQDSTAGSTPRLAASISQTAGGLGKPLDSSWQHRMGL